MPSRLLVSTKGSVCDRRRVRAESYFRSASAQRPRPSRPLGARRPSACAARPRSVLAVRRGQTRPCKAAAEPRQGGSMTSRRWGRPFSRRSRAPSPSPNPSPSRRRRRRSRRPPRAKQARARPKCSQDTREPVQSPTARPIERATASPCSLKSRLSSNAVMARWPSTKVGGWTSMCGPRESVSGRS